MIWKTVLVPAHPRLVAAGPKQQWKPILVWGPK